MARATDWPVQHAKFIRQMIRILPHRRNLAVRIILRGINGDETADADAFEEPRHG
jgi:hypothetical protein